MAVNALGQTLNLLLNQVQNKDLAQAFKLGENLRARIVDLLPDNKAIVMLKGLNVIAQLPAPLGGFAPAKGDVLNLAVLQSQAQATGQGPAVSLKLLSIESGQNNQAQSQNAGAANTTLAPQRPATLLAALETALTQANLPVNESNLRAAETLFQAGRSTDTNALRDVVGRTLQLLDVEIQAIAPPVSQTESRPALPPQLAQAFQEARDLLSLVATQPSPEAPLAQSLIRRIDSMLQGTTPASNMPQNPAQPTPQPAQLAVLVQTTLERASLQPSMTPQRLAPLISQGETLLAQIATLAPETLAQAEPQTPLPLPAALNLSLDQEAGAALLARLVHEGANQGPIPSANVIELLTQLADESSQVASPLANQILKASLTQSGETQAPASATLIVPGVFDDMAAALQAQPMAESYPDLSALRDALQTAGINLPEQLLQNLPAPILHEAVAILRSRDLPATRPAVLALAQHLMEGSQLSQDLQALVQEPLPALQQGGTSLLAVQKELNALSQFLAAQGLQPEQPSLATHIQNLSLTLGVDLESRLAVLAGLEPGLSVDPQPTNKPQDAPALADTLKGNLSRLLDSAKAAGRDPAVVASRELSQAMDQVAQKAQSAINHLDAANLLSRPTQTFDVITTPLPIWFQGQLQHAELSVFWRKGQPRELGKDPVSVVLVLDTRALGQVKIQMQVWKDECRCRVSVNSPDVSAFLKAAGPELTQAFSDNTPFRLSSLEFSAGQAAQSALAALDMAQQRLGAGLSLSA